MGGKGIGGLKARVGWECKISRGGASWAKKHSGGVQAEGVQQGSYSVGRCRIFRRSWEGSSRSEIHQEF